jgi:hypothetical protein
MKNKNTIQETMFGSSNSSSSSKSKSSINIKKQDLSSVSNDLKKLGKDFNINIVDEELNIMEPEAVITPQDKETIKYLSNVKDDKTGKVSQPFTIGTQKYQMVRGLAGDNQTVMAVFSHDETDDNGQNIIYSVDFFEENIVKPVMEKEMSNKHPVEENDFDKGGLMNHLNLNDLGGYKHFFVNINTGQVVGKFKNYKEMMRSGSKLGPEEDYMGIRQLKAFRAGKYFKEGFERKSEDGLDEEINIDKLKGDVKMLVDKMTNMFGKYFAKLDTPMEQSVFLAKMGQLINVPIEKLPQIISSYKDLAKNDPSEAPLTGDKPLPTNEGRIIKKKELFIGLNKKRNVIKILKVKDIK